MSVQHSRYSVVRQLTLLFSILSLGGIGLFLAAAIRNQSFDYSYLIWNLALAWLPWLLSLRLNHRLRHKLWSSWEGLGLTFLWLAWLPNSFYMLTDYIHLQDVERTDPMLDIVMFTSLIAAGLGLGYASLLLVHRQLRRRLPAASCWRVILTILFATSFAIYLGRALRWNSWDILINPVGLLFDISERFINPLSYPQMFSVTLSFFIFLSLTYFILWRMVRLAAKARF